MRKFRMRLGWSQAELARRLGVARNSVWRWEDGRMAIREPTARLFQRLVAEVAEKSDKKAGT